MSVVSPPLLLKLLAHDVRWHLITALAHSDQRVQELVSVVGRPMNLVSYHLKQLRDGDLVQERRSSADGRDIYYSLNLEQVASLFRAAGAQIHPALEHPLPADESTRREQADSPTRVLFLCTHNSARSQMAEALLRHMGGSGVAAHSAGTEPARVHPLAVKTMAELELDMDGQRAKHLDEYAGESFDYVITVCDKAREECPVFPGDPEQIHWSFPDPAAVTGDEAARLAAFRQVAQGLNTRLRYFLLVINRR